jgi:hypothetical protein
MRPQVGNTAIHLWRAFGRSLDQLPAAARTNTLRLLQQRFTDSPRMPAPDVHIVRGAESEVHTMQMGDNIHVTFAYMTDPRHPHNFVCVLRNIGMAI